MDFQSLISQKKKQLKSCSTMVTNLDGNKYMIEGNNITFIEKGIPFVIDEKPDMQVSMVLPGIFLSSQDPVLDLETLKQHKIKHVLSLGVEPHIKFAEITYSYVSFMDLPELDISEIIKVCYKVIDKYRKDNILVHCNAGVSRSATIVISYLMISEKVNFITAYDKVKAVRNCIKPNDGFVSQLKQLQFDTE